MSVKRTVFFCNFIYAALLSILALVVAMPAAAQAVQPLRIRLVRPAVASARKPVASAR